MVFCSPKQFHPALSHLNFKKSLHSQIYLTNLPMSPVIFVLKFEGCLFCDEITCDEITVTISPCDEITVTKSPCDEITGNCFIVHILEIC